MKLLLTDSGVRNASIHAALEDLLGKPIADSRALCIPTAGYGGPFADPVRPWEFVSGRSPNPMTELGWKSVGILELTALPSLDRGLWVSWVREADVLLANGGDTLFLHHWMRESGLAGLLPSLDHMVYVGLSAGSMVMTPRVGAEFMGWTPPSGDDRALGVVDFSIFPHLDHPDCPENTTAAAELWAAGIGGPAYAIDEQTAIKVADGAVEVISEGRWKYFGPAGSATSGAGRG
ncbi:peptidase E [Paractinoplanes deccanensis]|uniref:Peptidase E n=1 Tax=Paractinoplanes deccanensis TaxID=113561 RepID=A0ABQ3Y3I8_9ACTN|nr:Type 1 glutamine amidotransferase-like domain-containing protein [Actinoplanes deccanensis]GID74559.1 peptidase E [Actinoplanes deccanensis]